MKNKTRFILVLVGVLALLSLGFTMISAPVLTIRHQLEGAFTDLPGFLNWVIYSGGALLISSWLLDKIPKFMTLSVNWKKFINFSLAALVAIAFFAVLMFVPAATLAIIDPYFKIILGFIVAFGAQQAYHQLTKAQG